MADHSSGSAITKGVGGLITGGLGGFLAWLNTGSAGIGPGLVAFAAVLSGIGGLAFSHLYRRYLGLLAAGGNRKRSPSRDAYDALRNSLAEGNVASRLYTTRLTTFLDQVDRFFGDKAMTDQTLFPHAFGLKTPAPLWTAIAFDRCLLLALIYPLGTILTIWAVSGHVGPAEAALDLSPSLSKVGRALVAVAFGISGFAVWRRYTTRRRTPDVWLLVAGISAFSVPACGAGALPLAVAFSFSAFFFPFTGASGASLITILVIGVGTGAFCIDITGGAKSPLTFTLAGLTLGFLSALISRPIFAFLGRLSLFRLSVFMLGLMLACYGSAYLMSAFRSWQVAGPLLLFIGLLTLLNAPFDWASLGLTRALLRRGLELSGWWPYLLALVDAIAAAVIIAVLALTMVIGVQTFDHLAVHGGGKPVLPLKEFFEGIAGNPTAPQYWWAYALLLSTMIPSLANLMIGGASLLRGVPGLPTLLLGFMPIGKSVPTFDRHWMALVLTLQIFAGAILGILAQAFLTIIVIVYIMPPLGLGLLDMAREVAAFDLPARVGRLFGATM